MPDQRSSTGARAAGGRERGAGGGGLPKWLLPLLLAIIAIVVLVLLLRSCGDDGSSSSSKSKSSSAGSSASSSSSASAGTLRAGGSALFPAAGKDLTRLAGKSATGRRVRVQSVVPKVGFWVGASSKDRVFVEYGSRYKGAEPGSRKLSVKKGQRVNVTGPVRRATPRIIRQLTADPSDVRLLRRQGAFINANRVSKA